MIKAGLVLLLILLVPISAGKIEINEATENNVINLEEPQATCVSNYSCAGNSSWNQALADTLYADISVTGDNSSWNQALADTLYADISVTGDNSSWNQALADTLYADIVWAYNQSLEVYNNPDATWLSTYNSTYEEWAYNQSDGYEPDTFYIYTHLTNFTDDLLWTSEFNTTGDSRWATSGGNPFDQDLNTTENVTFNSIETGYDLNSWNYAIRNATGDYLWRFGQISEDDILYWYGDLVMYDSLQVLKNISVYNLKVANISGYSPVKFVDEVIYEKNISFSNYTGCSALETNDFGLLVCGSDDSTVYNQEVNIESNVTFNDLNSTGDVRIGVPQDATGGGYYQDDTEDQSDITHLSLGNGEYCIDENTSTYCYNVGSAFTWVFMNYTKPSGLLNADWEVYTDSTGGPGEHDGFCWNYSGTSWFELFSISETGDYIANYTVPADCLTSTYVSFKIEMDSGFGDLAYLREEWIWWNTTNTGAGNGTFTIYDLPNCDEIVTDENGTFYCTADDAAGSGNSSWNQSLAEERYVNVDGDIMSGGLENVSNSTFSGSRYDFTYNGNVDFYGMLKDTGLMHFMYWDASAPAVDFLTDVVIVGTKSLTINGIHLDSDELYSDGGPISIYTNDVTSDGTTIQNKLEVNENTGLITLGLNTTVDNLTATGRVCYDSSCSSFDNSTGRYWDSGAANIIWNGTHIIANG